MEQGSKMGIFPLEKGARAKSKERCNVFGIGTLSKIKAAKAVVTGTASTVRVLLFMLSGLGLLRVIRVSVAVRFLSGRLLPVAR